jgi:hypothetical protein
MGRWYYGDIEGKFWTGVQSSLDADNLGVIHCKEYESRCEHCTQLEEDAEDVCENGKEHDFTEDVSNYLWCYNKVDLLDLKEHITKYQKEFIETAEDKKLARRLVTLSKLVTFKNNEMLDKLFDELSFSPKNYDKVDQSILARIYLGWSIYWCIVEKGECTFFTNEL